MPYLVHSALLLCLLLTDTEQVAISRTENNRLSETLDNFEPLDYNVNQLISQHNSIKLTTQRMREEGQGYNGYLEDDHMQHISFSFSAFENIFNLRLHQDSSSIHPNVEMNVVGLKGSVKSSYDPATQYTGRVLGDVDSYVHGHILGSGVFDGIIHAFNNTFHIEPASRFVKDPSFHSLLYRYSDVRQEMRNTSRCDYERHLDKLRERYWPEGGAPGREEPEIARPGHGRQTRQNEFLDNPICPVFLAADHTFYQFVGGSDETQTITELITHLNEVNQIYRTTDFDEDGEQDNVAFTLARVEVFTDTNLPNYLFGNTQFSSSSDFLDTWSRYELDAYCLAMMFAYREFDDGVLGLAWVAGTGGKVGGICQQRIQLSSGARNLNTAIVTLLNFGQLQPRGVSIVTVAHEWGHNFGSPHDPLQSTVCSPGAFGDQNGNFLMYARATDGTQPNNDRFSTCSINSIEPVLLQKSPSCFLSTTAVCGNGLVEVGEQCDCGDIVSCQDPCCQASGTGDEECMFMPFADCSQEASTGGVCCTDLCLFVPADDMRACQPETVCSEESVCNGVAATCPEPVNFANGLNCSNTQTCLEGQCTGSICARISSHPVECQCTDATRLCDVCCMAAGDTSTCVPIDELGEERLYREAGRSCSNFEGYCSNGSPPECELVNNNNILDSLLDLFTLESAILFRDWLAQYWYIIVIVFIAIIVLAILLHFTYRRKKDDIKNLASNTMQRVRGGDGQRENRRQNSHKIQKMLPQQALTRLKRLFPTVNMEILKEFMVTSKSEEKAVDRLLDAGFPIYMVNNDK